MRSSTSPLHRVRVIAPPTPLRGQFGYRLDAMNGTLAIGALGTDGTAGAVYVYHSGKRFFDDDAVGAPQTLSAFYGAPGDAFGAALRLAPTALLASLPAGQDDGLPVTARVSAGNVHVYKHLRNVSAADSCLRKNWLPPLSPLAKQRYALPKATGRVFFRAIRWSGRQGRQQSSCGVGCERPWAF